MQIFFHTMILTQVTYFHPGMSSTSLNLTAFFSGINISRLPLIINRVGCENPRRTVREFLLFNLDLRFRYHLHKKHIFEEPGWTGIVNLIGINLTIRYHIDIVPVGKAGICGSERSENIYPFADVYGIVFPFLLNREHLAIN